MNSNLQKKKEGRKGTANKTLAVIIYILTLRISIGTEQPVTITGCHYQSVTHIEGIPRQNPALRSAQ